MGKLFRDSAAAADSAELALKQTLLQALQEAIRARGWKQVGTADELGLDQAKISKLMNGHLTDFSAERLVRLLALLGHRVDVTVSRGRR
jgi:predicted XRE-type DNA-binding protein